MTDELNQDIQVLNIGPALIADIKSHQSYLLLRMNNSVLDIGISPRLETVRK